MIVLKTPLNGANLDLLTDEQIKFLESDRTEVQVEDFDYLEFREDDGDDCSFQKGVSFQWESDGESTIQISESETFKSYYSKAGDKACNVENLKCGTRYFWRVVCAQEVSDVFYFDTKDKYPRFIKIDGLTNVRDCGGWKTVTGKRIKQGLLYRGSEMNSHFTITEDGLKTMSKVLKIKSVLDLRRGDIEEVENVYKGKYINIPVRPYSEWFQHPDSARKIFEFVLNEENYPVYFHCLAGADRTGTLAFLLGALLGISYDDLIDDYECTSLSTRGVRSRNTENMCKSFLNDFNAFKGETPEEKAKNYLLSCGITENLIEKFRKFMLY